MKIPIVASVLLALFAAEAAAQGYGRSNRSQRGTKPGTELGAKLRVWQATMEGDTSSDEKGIISSTVDIDDTMGVDEDQLIYDLTLWGEIPLIGQARVSYMQGKLDGDSIASQNFVFSGSSFTAGAALETEWEIEGFAIMWDYPLLSEQIGAGAINGNAQVGYQYHFMTAHLAGGGVTGSDSLASTTITLGLRIFTQLASWLWADIEVNYAVIDMRSEVDADFLEYSVDLQVNPFEELFIGVGYRRIELDASDERSGGTSEFKIDTVIDGWFISASYHF